MIKELLLKTIIIFHLLFIILIIYDLFLNKQKFITLHLIIIPFLIFHWIFLSIRFCERYFNLNILHIDEYKRKFYI
jgi:hypothetical protein